MGRAKVLSVLAGLPVDTPARGEIWVAPAVLESQGLPNNTAGVAELAVNMGADLCFISCGGSQAVPNRPEALEEAVAEVHARDLACGIVIDGPWQRLAQYRENGLLQLLKRLGTCYSQVREEIAAEAALVHEELRAWARAGADMVLLADDLAYNEGLYFSPNIFARLLLPYYRQFLTSAAERQVPMGFHSDGDLRLLLPALVDAGFSFLSLEPEVMDLSEVHLLYGDRVALLSGIPVAWLCPDPLTGVVTSDISADFSALTKIDHLILSSSCGLFDADFPAALIEVYRIAERMFFACAR